MSIDEKLMTEYLSEVPSVFRLPKGEVHATCFS